MARTRSSAPSRRAPPPSSRSAPPPASRPAPPPAHTAAPQQGGGMLSGLGATMAQGFAWGTGTAVAREAVGAVFGGGGSSAPQQPAPQYSQPVQQAPQACAFENQNFMRCLQDNPNDSAACNQYLQALQACTSQP